MRTSQIANYALRLSFGQASEVASAVSTSPDKIASRSAVILATFGIALSSFSIKQMLNNSPKVTVRKL